MKILFINACVRENSRTLSLAHHLLSHLSGEITEVNLAQENIPPLCRETLNKRDRLISEGNRTDSMLKYACQLADADEVVIAAPYWDLSFPAMLKSYFEAVMVLGITFCYDGGMPKGLCRAKRLIYVTTAGGMIYEDFGYSYAKALAATFFGIEKTLCFKAEGLDIVGADVKGILDRAKSEIVKEI